MSPSPNKLPTENSDTCRYSSKPCSNLRAIKKTGDLHSFCEFHRLMANRNQRRCEQKRRNKRQLENAVLRRGGQPHGVSMRKGVDSVPSPRKYRRRRTTVRASPTAVDAAPVITAIDTSKNELEAMPFVSDLVIEKEISLEPFTHPVELHEEDLQYLFMTIVDTTHAIDTFSNFSMDAPPPPLFAAFMV